MFSRRGGDTPLFLANKMSIQEILSNSTVLKFKTPVRINNFSATEKAEAWMFAESVYDVCFENGSFTSLELESYLAEQGIWIESREQKYLQDLEDMQSMKVDYYDNFAIPSRRQGIKSAITKKMALVHSDHMDKTYLSEYTCEAARDEAYGIHLFNKVDNPFVYFRKFQSARISEDVIRDLYFDHTWRMVWGVSKDAMSIFGIHMNHLNENQLSLLYWSKLYDNISESSEAPSSASMKDPLAVDGWLIKQSKKRDAEERLKSIPGKDGEVFLPARNKQEAKEIMSLNTSEASRIIKSKAKELSKGVDIDEANFAHVKQDISMKINEASMRKG